MSDIPQAFLDAFPERTQLTDEEMATVNRLAEENPRLFTRLALELLVEKIRADPFDPTLWFLGHELTRMLA